MPEPAEGFEPPTFALQKRCSAAELCWQTAIQRFFNNNRLRRIIQEKKSQLPILYRSWPKYYALVRDHSLSFFLYLFQNFLFCCPFVKRAIWQFVMKIAVFACRHSCGFLCAKEAASIKLFRQKIQSAIFHFTPPFFFYFFNEQ